VYHNNHDRTPGRKTNKLGTIRENEGEGNGSDAGSDTAYFTNDNEEEEFNNRDDYSSEEEKEFEKRKEFLENTDDEDN
jgi:hypothetical protein